MEDFGGKEKTRGGKESVGKPQRNQVSIKQLTNFIFKL